MYPQFNIHVKSLIFAFIMEGHYCNNDYVNSFTLTRLLDYVNSFTVNKIVTTHSLKLKLHMNSKDHTTQILFYYLSDLLHILKPLQKYNISAKMGLSIFLLSYIATVIFNGCFICKLPEIKVVLMIVTFAMKVSV